MFKADEILAPWKKLGCTNVHMLHTHDPKVADTEEFAKALRDANAVWFNGGRQWNIVDSYANTLTYREFHKLLERGGVIAVSDPQRAQPSRATISCAAQSPDPTL